MGTSARRLRAQIAAYTGHPDAAQLLASSLDSQRSSTRWLDQWPDLAAAARWLGASGDESAMVTIESFMSTHGLGAGILAALDTSSGKRIVETDDPIGRNMTTEEIVDFTLERLVGPDRQ